MDRPFLCDAIVTAVSRLIDDSQTEKRNPTHSDISQQIERAGLSARDPASHGASVGKAKRLRAVLYWALSNDPAKGEALIRHVLATVRGVGGFRESSPNHCGREQIRDTQAAFDAVGWQLTIDGELQPPVLESLTGRKLTDALAAYAERARRGRLDSPLLAGTAKDLVEAVAAHVLVQKWGAYSPSGNFKTLLGQAFSALGLSTPTDPEVPGEIPQKKVQRTAFELACAINSLRNKQGTGHGRPWVSSVTEAQARFAIESMGSIAGMMLDEL
jgi:hypothetical protein